MHSSSNANNCFSHPNRVQRQDFKSKLPSQPTTGLMNTSQQEKTTTSNKSGRYMNQRKLRKKGGSGSKRETRFQMNGSTDQNLHSLKVTIRRTYNSSELENGVCAIVNTPEENTNSNNTTNNNGNNHESLHRLYTPVNSIQPEHCDPQHLNGKLNTKDLYNLRGLSTLKDSRVYVDSSTSTVDSATLTEPNLLGPCEPGTKIIVEGVVWMEATGMLVLSLHWRGRNYMGTLLDSSKQTFAPTCMDKGVASALNLLRGRKAWCDPSQRGYQARGIHHFHHMRHHRRGGGSGVGTGGHGVSGSMTTRSASAAAAAASQDSTAETDVDAKEQQPTNNDPYSTDCIDQPYMAPETTFNNHNNNNKRTLPPSDIPQRGAKGRRRRGGGAAGRRSIIHHSVNSAQSLSNENLLTSSEVKSSAPTDDNAVVHNYETPVTDSTTTGDSDSTSHLPLSCPFIDCKKRFADILSMRYHFTLGHSTQQTNETESVQSLSNVYPSQRKQLRNSMKTEKKNAGVTADNHDDDDDDAGDGVDDYAEDGDDDEQVEISICDISASSSSPPPKLARAHVIKDRSSSDSNDTSLLLINGDENDDNIEPPKLHRVISIPDSFPGVGVHPTGIGDSTTLKFDTINNNIINNNTTTTTTNNNNNVSDIPDDEPPAASPAYSDISDDGTVSSTTTNIPMLNVARATVDVHSSRESLLSNSPSTILSSNLSNQSSLSQGYIDVSRRLNLSPLILSACSPTLLTAGTGDSSKLYLPANLFPSNLKGVNSIFYQNPATTVKCVDKQNIENGLKSIGNNSTINFLNDISSPQSSSSSSSIMNGISLAPAPPVPANLIPPQPLSNNHQHHSNSSRPLTFLSVSPGLINEQNTRPSSTGPFISNPPYTFCVSRNSPIPPPLPGVSDQRILSPHNTNHNHNHSTSHRQPPTMS
uniref:C2H2-type domain-containing protein n=1 Tax=Trichobilharzia regenti TaxID=157069 RepID=A0AA85K8Q9_TRIRE|nr:unnamed protein product [Trichobilharzia regenti]